MTAKARSWKIAFPYSEIYSSINSLSLQARSSTDVCLRSSQGETDTGRIFRDPEIILFYSAEERAASLRQLQQEWYNHVLK